MSSLFSDGIRRTPPLVMSCSRRPPPAWLPSGWETGDCPAIDDPEAIRQWLGYHATSFRRCGEHFSPEAILDGVELFEVNDAYRLVRHLVRKKRWSDQPQHPNRRFFTSKGAPQFYFDMASEFEKVLEWVDACISREAQRSLKEASDRRLPISQPRSDFDALILATLNHLHGFDGASIKVYEPKGIRALSKEMKGKPSATTVKRWFDAKFKGRRTYKAACLSGQILIDLKLRPAL